MNHQAFVKNYFDTFNRHDWIALSELYANPAEFKDPSLGEGIVRQSREQISSRYAALSMAFPDVMDEVVDIYPSGEKNLIVEFIATGTAPDGSPFRMPICTIFTVENGLITRDFTYYDNFEDSE